MATGAAVIVVVRERRRVIIDRVGKRILLDCAGRVVAGRRRGIRGCGRESVSLAVWKIWVRSRYILLWGIASSNEPSNLGGTEATLECTEVWW